MENLAHSLCGLRIAELGYRERVGPRALWIGVVAANLPDLDVLLFAWDRQEATWQHRGLTHSFFGWPILALAGAWASRRWTRTGRYRDHLELWALGLLSHVLLDWPTTYGTQLFWPLTDTRFSLRWIFILDPMFWVLLGVLPLALRRFGAGSAAKAGLASLAAWVLFSGMMHDQAVRMTPGRADIVVPAPMAPVRWTATVTRGDEVDRYWVTPWGAEPAGTFAAPVGPAVDAVRATHAGERYFWMAKAPVVLRDEGGELELLDLCYTSWAAPDNVSFHHVWEVPTDGSAPREVEP